MLTEDVKEFASLLIMHVRDSAVAACDISLNDTANGPIAKRWRRFVQKSDLLDLASEMIPDCVDNVLFYLLYAIDEGLLEISFTSSSGKIVKLNLAGESEMAGWYMAENGWRSEYSKERYNDD